MVRGELPADNLIQGFLVFIGGILLITPGFITDIWGLALVLPFTRFLFVSSLKNYFIKKIQSGSFKFYTNVNGEWQSSDEWRDVSPEAPKFDKPAKVIDINNYKKDR